MPAITTAENPILSPAKEHQLPCLCSLSQDLWVSLTAGPAPSPSLVLKNGHPDHVQTVQPRSSLPLPPAKNGDARLLALFALPDSPEGETFLHLGPSSAPQSPVRNARDIAVDLKTFLRQHLASLPAHARQQVLEWLAPAALEKPCARPLAEKLYQVRDALRERSPAVVITPEKHRGLHVDHLFRIDPHAYYLRGWASLDSGPLQRLTVISPEGARVELLDRLFWHARPDIDELYKLPADLRADSKPGFLCYFELPLPSVLERGWIIQARDAQGESFEAPISELNSDHAKARQFLAGDLFHERLPAQEFRTKHVLPAITRLQERHHHNLRLNYVQQFGPLVDNPDVSIIIPLYRRIDFIEHQLAQFAHDPELRRAEIIYMLDSPELADPMRDYASALYELYRIPFRLAALRSNAGFAGVNNLGAGLARGRLLLLLNSDILPDRPGWLGRMQQFYDSKPQIGALGVKLLFEDNTLQHAGLYFRPQPGTGLWENQHYFKGLDRSLPAANVVRQVPAVSAACLMIARQPFLDLGGLRGIYVQGDYEDSDLCLRLRELGREIWYLPSVELFHLEGQSYPNEERSRNLALNRWMHSWFWTRTLQSNA